MSPPRHRSISRLLPHEKAARASKWAKIMTKWLVSNSALKKSRWRFVEFGGPSGAESRGIVDFLAIRKNHRHELPPVRRGDLLEIIIVQAKGGSAPTPTEQDRLRLRIVKRHHKARDVLLAVRNKRGVKPSFSMLKGDSWVTVEARTFFK